MYREPNLVPRLSPPILGRAWERGYWEPLHVYGTWQQSYKNTAVTTNSWENFPITVPEFLYEDQLKLVTENLFIRTSMHL